MKRLHFPTLCLTCALGAPGLLISAPLAAQHSAGHSMVSPDALKWADLPSLPPGAKIAIMQGPMNEAVPFTVRVRIPANYRVPAHWHPAIEHVSVLSGTLYMGLGKALDVTKGMAVPVGGFAVMPPKTPHFAYTTSEPVEFQLHGVGPWGITYINPADDPRNRQQ
jgi:hypothetical protein